MHKYIAVVLFVAASLRAQTAKVVQLSPEESTKAKTLYDQKAEIEKKIEALNDQIRTRYLTEPSGKSGYYCISTTGKACVLYKDGWYGGKFTYSEDFKFIVPPSKDASGSSYIPAGTLGCGIFTTNASQ